MGPQPLDLVIGQVEASLLLELFKGIKSALPLVTKVDNQISVALVSASGPRLDLISVSDDCVDKRFSNRIEVFGLHLYPRLIMSSDMGVAVDRAAETVHADARQELSLVTTSIALLDFGAPTFG